MIQCLDLLVDPSDDALPFPDPTVTAPPIPWVIPSLKDFHPAPFNFTPDLGNPGFEVRLGGSGSRHRVSQSVTPPIELVQKFITNPGFAVATDDQAVSFPNPPGAGNCLIAIVCTLVEYDAVEADSTGDPGLTVAIAGSNLGITWTNIGFQTIDPTQPQGQQITVSMWHRQAGAAPAEEQTITVTPTNNGYRNTYIGTGMIVCLLEYKHAVSVANHTTNTEFDAATGTLTAGSLPISSKGQGVIAAFGFAGYDFTGIFTPGDHYSVQEQLPAFDSSPGAPGGSSFLGLYVTHRLGVDPSSDEATVVDSTGAGDRYTAMSLGIVNG